MKCEELGDWYGVILVVVYSVFDFIGRSTPNSLVCLRRNWVILGTVSRVLFLPLSLLVKKQFSNPFSIGTLLALLGTSHGSGFVYLTELSWFCLGILVCLRLDLDKECLLDIKSHLQEELS